MPCVMCNQPSGGMDICDRCAEPIHREEEERAERQRQEAMQDAQREEQELREQAWR